MTFIAPLRHNGISAPCPFDGPMNGESFRTYVEPILLPTLRAGDIVMMGNLGSHKTRAVREAIRSVGARRLFLRAYSPDLNPIEQVFAKLKTQIRKAKARTCEPLMMRSPPCFQPTQARNPQTTSPTQVMRPNKINRR